MNRRDRQIRTLKWALVLSLLALDVVCIMGGSGTPAPIDGWTAAVTMASIAMVLVVVA